jgi:hypothetical protein
LFIGLGGTGKEVLMRLRKRYFDALAPRLLSDRTAFSPPPFVRCLLVDTDCRGWTPQGENPEAYAAVQPMPNEYVYCGLTRDMLHGVFAEGRCTANPQHARWLDPALEGIGWFAGSGGTGGYRQLGRLAFILHYAEVRDHIERLLADMLADAGRPDRRDTEPGLDAVEAVIVTSLAGGAGSGMLLDTAYLVRDILARRLPHQEIRWVSLVGVLPSAFRPHTNSDTYRRLEANAYATLLELDRFGPGASTTDMFVGKTKDAAFHGVAEFPAPWKDSESRFRGVPAYDLCYLIDSRNGLNHAEPLTLDAVCRMIADSFFLDGQRTELGMLKRGSRATSSATSYGAVEIRVRRPWGDRSRSRACDVDPDTGVRDIVYVTRHACAFSSFGLSEIRFDSVRLSRAVTYRLGELVVRERLLGQSAAGRVSESQYQAWAHEDLVTPAVLPGEQSPPQFTPDALLRALYQTETGNWLDRLKEDLHQVRSQEPDHGTESLRRILQKHRELLGTPNGAAVETLRANQAELAGNQGVLGPYRRRVRQAANTRAHRHGILIARELLARYVRELVRTDDDVQQWTREPSLTPTQLLSGLEATDRLWWPFRARAWRREFSRTCDQVERHLINEYRRTAVSSIRQIVAAARCDLAGPGREPATVQATEPTLGQVYITIQGALEKLAFLLNQRFDECRCRRSPPGDRVQTLFPQHWTSAEYDRLVWDGLAAAGCIPPHHGPSQKLDLATPELDRQVLQRVAALISDDVGTEPVIGLLRRWTRDGLLDDTQLAAIVDQLCLACAPIVEREIERNAALDSNVIDLLETKHTPQTRRHRLDRLIHSAAPYFPRDTLAPLSSTVPLASAVDWLEMDAVEMPPEHAERKQRVVREIEGLRQQVVADAQRSLVTVPGDTGTLLYWQEVQGMPLLSYAGLCGLRAAYYCDAAPSEVTCHIDRSWAWPPDAGQGPAADPERLEEIAAGADLVVLAILVALAIVRDNVHEEAETLFAFVRDSFGSGEVSRLGTRLDHAVYAACTNSSIRRYLQAMQEGWERRATAQQWAAVYAAALWSYDRAQEEIEEETGEHTSPLRNCLGAIVRETGRRLKDSPAGVAWYKHLARPDRDATAARARWRFVFDQLVADGVLLRVADGIPLFAVRWDHLDRLRLP